MNAGVEAGQKVAAGQHIATLRQNDPRSTGPHLHLEGRDAKGALVDPKGLLMPKATSQAGAEGTMKPFTSTGWKPKAPGADAVPADPGFTSSGWKPASAADAVKKLPMPEPKPALGSGQGDRAGMGPAGGSTMRGGSTVHVVNHINAGNQSPAEMAGHIERHISTAWNYRAHDLEPELT